MPTEELRATARDAGAATGPEEPRADAPGGPAASETPLGAPEKTPEDASRNAPEARANASEARTAGDALDAMELLGRVSYGRLATSMRAMPFVAPARHIVRDGGVVLRIHRGFGYHRACNGGVVAYGADNFNSGGKAMWSVQFTGTADIVRPTPDDLRLFGDEPFRADGERFEPVYMRIEPQFATVHTLDYLAEQPNRHVA
ncbi:pyridoxamine 5'-phosphate oxidase family protein [Streptomyces sp. NPDC014894]|uniref:pyridoxamine 5'-phosphate oxidase family protein n=1 Tax=Streptomyces sp. NPDC014894 TaxID=3364931 RepID=UPI0036FABCF6